MLFNFVMLYVSVCFATASHSAVYLIVRFDDMNGSRVVMRSVKY